MPGSILALAAASALAGAAPAPAVPARALRGAGDLDYPPQALRAGEQGTVEFLLDVAASGRVTGCAITRSSGSATLDSETCRMLTVRGRYAPARDSAGAPQADKVAGKVDWVLPPPEPAPAD